MTRQHKDLKQLDGNISLNSTVFDAQEQEMPAEPTITEDILTLKLDQEGLRTSPNLHLHLHLHHQLHLKKMMHLDLTRLATSLKLES